MLKRSITFTDFNDEEQTEVHFFNMMKSELVRKDVSYKGGMEAAIKAILAAEDKKALVEEFEFLILGSYGERSEDGKKFLKSPAMQDEFRQSPAYDALFIELATDADKCADFINGIMPKDMAEQMKKATPQDKPVGPPPAPRPPTQ